MTSTVPPARPSTAADTTMLTTDSLAIAYTDTGPRGGFDFPRVECQLLPRDDGLVESVEEDLTLRHVEPRRVVAGSHREARPPRRERLVAGVNDEFASVGRFAGPVRG